MHPLVVPCEFQKQVIYNNSNYKYVYWVRFYLITTYLDGKFETYTFLHQSEQLDNAVFMKECGVDGYLSSYRAIVTPDNEFHELFNLIEDYVSSSNKD